MNYLTLCRHVKELKQALSDNPAVIGALKLNGRAVCLRLKRQNGPRELVFSLEMPEQGFWLSEGANETDMPSSFVKTANRLITNARLVFLGMLSPQAFDRVVKLQFISINPYFGNRSDFYMICEFTGRVSDIFICDSDLKILDRLGFSSNNSIGSVYKPLPSPNYANAALMPSQRLNEILSYSPSEWANYIGGLSNIFVREAELKLKNSSDKSGAFKKLYNAANNSDGPVYVWAYRGKIKTITSFFITQSDYELKASFATVNEAANWLFNTVCAPRSINELKKRCLNVLNNELKKKNKLLAKQSELLAGYENSAHYQRLGQLLTANLYRIKPGQQSIEADDWQSGSKLLIKLNPLKSAASQAEKYFALYKKAKRGTKLAKQRLIELQNDVSALKEQIWLTQTAETETDLQTDLLLPKPKRKKEHKKYEPKRAKAFFSPLLEIGGCRYYVGKNAKQNDLLTFQFAKRGDIWFHANDVPGSHVLLKKPLGAVTQKDLLTGALLAAWFSFSKESSKACVDYTDIAFVKRVKGAALGRVIYTHQRTLVVNPQNAKELLK